MKPSPLASFAFLSWSVVACGASSSTNSPGNETDASVPDAGSLAVDAGSPSKGSGDASAVTNGDDADGASSTIVTDDGGVVGHLYEVHLRATQSPITFSDRYAGETPIDQHIAIRKLALFREADDPSPVTVFDRGANPVEAGLNDGDDTVCGSAPGSSIPAATFTVAHVTVGYYRFSVASTMHADGQSLPGEYDDLEVLTNATNVEGSSQNQGYYRFVFQSGGTTYGTLTGDDLMTPADTAGGGLTLVTMDGEADYEFPVNLKTDASLAATAKVVMTVNTYENFRWQDASSPGYAAGVFDTTPTRYETVESFGANSFTIDLE